MRDVVIDRRRLLGTALTLATLASSSVWAAPRRLVSVGGAITETLFALGAQDELVGVDTTSIYPAAARALPSVGYARTLSAEGVLALRPTLLLASEEAGPPAVLRQLEAARLPVRVLDSRHRFDGVLERVRQLAELSGRPAQGQELSARLRADWARVEALATVPGAKPRALFVLSHSTASVMVSGTGTAADAMLGYAGATNAFGAVAGYKPLTPEAAVAAAPEVLLFTEQGLAAAGGIDGALRLPGLALTPAGRARRVVALDAMFMLAFGPRLPQAVLALHGALRGLPPLPQGGRGQG